MMHADRQRENQEHDEGEPPHRVAVEPPAGGFGYQGIKSDIGRHQPEIDDRVQCHREQRAPEGSVDQIAPPKGPWQQYTGEFDLHTRSRPVAVIANIASGKRRPGLSRPHAVMLTTISTTQIIDPAISRTAPR